MDNFFSWDTDSRFRRLCHSSTESCIESLSKEFEHIANIRVHDLGGARTRELRKWAIDENLQLWTAVYYDRREANHDEEEFNSVCFFFSNEEDRFRFVLRWVQ